jgi:tetratricopeptide (TPR) repeat protein
VLNDVVTGVTIAPGNSGGPCINLATGSVIGLNTYVPLGGGGSDMLNYSGVCAIDKAVELFPQLRWYPHGAHMTAEQHLELANMLLTTGRVRGARMELERALEEEDALSLDQRASLYWLCALVCNRRGDYDGFLEWRARSFELEPDFFPAASNVALSLAGDNRIDQALEICDALVRAEPASWSRRHVRADALRQAGLHSQALAELEQAAALAPSEQPDLVLMRGEVLAASGDDEAARTTFEHGAEAAPHHLGLRLALAEHLAACGETSAAAIAYRALVNDFPTSRESLAAFGRFKRDHLLQAEDALNALCQAIGNSMDAGQFAADLMVEASELATATHGQEQVGLILALVLFEEYPGWRARAHQLLGESWEALGVASLAAVHAGCATADGGTLPVRVPLLMPSDVVLMAVSSYPSELVLDVLDVASLGFALDLRSVEQLVAQAPQARDHIPLLLVSTMRDQMAGTGALGASVEVAFLDKVSVDADGSHAPITFRNTSAVPLTSLIVRKAYYDEHSNELYASQGLLATRDPVLRPGAERSLDFRFNSWAELEAAGVPRERVASFSVSVVSARNASYLEQIRIVGGVSESGYRLSLVNQSLFTIKRVVLRCDYQLESGQPVVDARGLPVFSTSVIEDVTLPPSSQLDGVVIPEWTDPGHVHGLGAVLPSDADVRLTPALVDVVLSIS